MDNVKPEMLPITSKIYWVVYDLEKIQENLTHYIKMTSDPFYSHDLPLVAWQLYIGISQNMTNYMYVWLRQMGPNGMKDLVNTKYKIYAINDNGNINISESTYKFENQEKMGNSSVSLDKVLRSDGSVKLICEIEYNYYNSTDYLKNNYRNMLERETFSDFVIKVGDYIIKTHRCILAQNSEVFSKMLEQDGMTEAQNGEVIITDTSPECVRAMLEFFYTGEISKDTLDQHFVGIFAIAHKYGVELLKYKCEHFICSNINAEDFIKYFGIISLYSAPTLEKAIIDYIRANKMTILYSEEWEMIKYTYPNVVFRILELGI